MTTPVEIEPNEPPWLRVSLASPIDVYSWSYGAIETDKLFDFEHERFHAAGLFSERIFGPIRDYTCACGQLQGQEHFPAVCDACSVSIHPRSVRSQRMAHINLPVPILHPWFWGRDHAPLELLLGMPHQELKQVVRRRRFIQLGASAPHLRSTLCSAATSQAEGDRTLDGFLARSGGDAVRRLLARTNFATLLKLLEARQTRDDVELQRVIDELQLDPRLAAKVVRQSRRLEARVELLRRVVRGDIKPEHAVLEALPVIPAGLRAGKVGTDGRIVVDGVTTRYRRIVRLCQFIREGLESVPVAQGAWLSGDGRRRLVRLERRIGAEIAALFDELLHNGSPASRSGDIRSRRRDLPGKRVDFSARSVVVPDPKLRLFQCRVPRKQIAEVLLPDRSKSAYALLCELADMTPNLANHDPSHWESKFTQRPLIFSLAPFDDTPALTSLHPRLTDDRAVHVHPLMVAAFSRSMADAEAIIHLPLSIEAELDCNRLSFPVAAMRDAVNGKCNLRFAGDAVVGCFYAGWFSNAQQERRDRIIGRYDGHLQRLQAFASPDDVQTAWEERRVHIHDAIQLRLAPGQTLLRCTEKPVDVSERKRRVWTTAGRAMLNAHLPQGSPFFDVPFDERDLARILQHVIARHGDLAAERFVERATAFGLHALTRSGLSLSQSDFRPPTSGSATLERLTKDIARFNRLYERGVIGDFERRSCIDESARAAQHALQLASVEQWESVGSPMPLLLAAFGEPGRGSREILNHLVGIIGTVWSWSWSLSAPVLQSFAQGVGPLGYFRLAAANRRKALTKLSKSAAPRRLRRRLMAALGDIVVTLDDCGVRQGVLINRGDDDQCSATFGRRIEGRVILHALSSRTRSGAIPEANELISWQTAEEIAALEISTLQVRSPLYCQAPSGVCRKCYGRDPATGKLVELGAPVGIKAALAVADDLRAINNLQTPDLGSIDYQTLKASASGGVSLAHVRTAANEHGNQTVVSLGGVIEIHADDGSVAKHRVPHGAYISVATGLAATPETQLAAWNRRFHSLYASAAGTARILHIAAKGDGPRLLNIVDRAGVVIDGCYLPADAKLHVDDGSTVAVGTLLAKFTRPCDYGIAPSGNRFDRLKFLLEGRSEDRALLAPVDGTIELRANLDRRRCTILLHPRHGGRPWRFHVRENSERFPIVRTGQIVLPGDPLTRGQICLANLARCCGAGQVQSQLMDEVHARLADLTTDGAPDVRPWEVMIAQMLGFVRIESSGDSYFRHGDIVRRGEVHRTNRRLKKQLKVEIQGSESLLSSVELLSPVSHQRQSVNDAQRTPTPPEAVVSIPWPAGWSSLIFGADAISRQTSFLTAGGFMPTRLALVQAALEHRCKALDGVQASVIAGRLIPAGSGWAPAPIE